MSGFLRGWHLPGIDILLDCHRHSHTMFSKCYKSTSAKPHSRVWSAQQRFRHQASVPQPCTIRGPFPIGVVAHRVPGLQPTSGLVLLAPPGPTPEAPPPSGGAPPAEVCRCRSRPGGPRISSGGQPGKLCALFGCCAHVLRVFRVKGNRKAADDIHCLGVWKHVKKHVGRTQSPHRMIFAMTFANKFLSICHPQ